jgi:hypothetical protein
MSLQPEQPKKEGNENDDIEHLFVPLPASKEIPYQEHGYIAHQQVVKKGDECLKHDHGFSSL